MVTGKNTDRYNLLGKKMHLRCFLKRKNDKTPKDFFGATN